MEKSVSLTGEEVEQLKTAEASQEKSKKKRTFLLPRLTKRAESSIVSFGNLDESAVPGFRAASVTYTGSRHRTKDVLLTFMFKDEIQRWMEQAEKDEEKVESLRSCSVRNRSFSTDEDLTE